MRGNKYIRIHSVGAVLLATALLIAFSVGPSPKVLAYNTNPHGVINFCTLYQGKTIIYGWGHDPDAPAGGYPKVTVTVGTQVATVNTNIGGYHDTAINKYLSTNWPAAPTSKIYGFAASYANLYKGTGYGVSGIVHNYGNGSDTTLKVDTAAGSIDGISSPTKLNANNTVPDACLNPKPAPPPPPPPAPTPPPPDPTPPPTHKPSTGSTGSHSIPPAANPTTPADASVAAGTLTAMLTVPADGATTVSIAYGTNSASLDYATDPATSGGGTSIIGVTNLTPKTQYFYQLVRTDASGKSSTSAQADFTTAGYVVSLQFVDAKVKPVAGISGVINDTNNSSVKSDKSGNMVFKGLDDGQYTVTFRYGKLNYTREFNTETAGDGSDNPGNVIELKDTVNVSRLSGGSAAGRAGPDHGSKWPLVFIVIVLLAAASGAVIWVRSRRAGLSFGITPPHGDYALSTLPSASSSIPPVKPPKKIKHGKKDAAPVHLEHVGESLRDMVLKSMHEEAQKRKANKPD